MLQGREKQHLEGVPRHAGKHGSGGGSGAPETELFRQPYRLRTEGIGKELCAKVGITEANLSILRSGKANGVRFHTINRICYYLDCGVGDLLRFDGRLEDANDET